MEIPRGLVSLDMSVLENTLNQMVAHLQQNENIIKDMRNELNENQHVMKQMKEDIEWCLRFEQHIDRVKEEAEEMKETLKNHQNKLMTLETCQSDDLKEI